MTVIASYERMYEKNSEIVTALRNKYMCIYENAREIYKNILNLHLKLPNWNYQARHKFLYVDFCSFSSH